MIIVVLLPFLIELGLSNDLVEEWTHKEITLSLLKRFGNTEYKLQFHASSDNHTMSGELKCSPFWLFSKLTIGKCSICSDQIDEQSNGT